MKASFITVFLLFGFSSSVAEEETEAELLSREERAASYWGSHKPPQYGGCDAGYFTEQKKNESGVVADHRCILCPKGEYLKVSGFWTHCVPCENQNQTTPPGYNVKCFDECDPGKGWNRTTLKCSACPVETFQSDKGFGECQKCPVFTNSTRGDAKCLLECPKGFEPTEDNTTCTQCRVGYYNKVQGKKGVNQECVRCCEPPCDKNWTYYVGANATKQCIKLPKPLKTCFPYLVTALEAAAKYIYSDSTKRTLIPLLDALCRSDADLGRLKEEIDACSVRTVNIGGVPHPAFPRLRINATYVLDLYDVFSGATVPVCQDPEETSATDGGESTNSSDENALSRKKRAWSDSKPEQYGGCDAGYFTVDERNQRGGIAGFPCKLCPKGQFTKISGFWKHCLPCEDENQTTPPGYNAKCFDECVPGKGWNRTALKCVPCPVETFQPDKGFGECQKCPVFTNSTQGDAECLLECPRGFEPTEDNTTCTQCRVGYYQKVPGRKGVNQECVRCCEPPCDKNWTYVVGANATNQCIKLPVPLKTCFPYLITALERAAQYIYADDTKRTIIPLLDALCKSGVDLERLKNETTACGVKTVKVAGVSQPAYPKLRINASHVLDLFDVFSGETEPACKEPDDAETTTTGGATTGTASSTPSTEWTTTSTTSSTSTTATTTSTSSSTSTTWTSTPSTTTTDIPFDV